jgi:hypothetical protein
LQAFPFFFTVHFPLFLYSVFPWEHAYWEKWNYHCYEIFIYINRTVERMTCNSYVLLLDWISLVLGFRIFTVSWAKESGKSRTGKPTNSRKEFGLLEWMWWQNSPILDSVNQWRTGFSLGKSLSIQHVCRQFPSMWMVPQHLNKWLCVCVCVCVCVYLAQSLCSPGWPWISDPPGHHRPAVLGLDKWFFICISLIMPVSHACNMGISNKQSRSVNSPQALAIQQGKKCWINTTKYYDRSV